MRRSLFRAIALVALAPGLAHCSDDDVRSDVDAGAALDASGFDATIGDAALDASAVDAGSPCVGPPGLYAPGSCTTVADDIRPFTPAHRLWSDGAEKERFVSLPPGSTIDTSMPDGWVFPVGTRAYKTFSLGGQRLETRVLEKTTAGQGTASWSMRVYAWNATQDAVSEITSGAIDVLGTTHDIPEQAACAQCHSDNTRDVLLGFSAIQLSHDGPGVTLHALNAEGALSAAITASVATIPGDAIDRAALGAMHANCGHCHHGPSAPAGLRFWVPTGLSSVTATPSYATAVGVEGSWATGGATHRIVAGMPEASTVFLRMNRRGVGQMPPIATDVIDDEAVAAVRAWITRLTP